MAALHLNVGSATNRSSVEVESEMTLLDLLKDQGIDPETGSVRISGRPIPRSDFDKTLAQLGAHEGSSVLQVVKAAAGR